ncbi:hypothetical protein D0Z08_04425 [Nocardioides immobilis]|uniref:J domain-containing protein n=1 Tax=Nocardioides immobilis TaxID=2049295 RepID=A0A417Y6L2_9ACTN|nr:DnaJ domain-containing protein [Nocardioides immobilis]RHW28235.1 hypothetical protein D0Z08_04425 [Nocardioides immobilis]
MSVSLYDLLDVDPSATAAEIRTAWKASIADLDPTDRRFRAFNDAAGVLLDPEKRAAYDAELAAEPDEAEDAAPADEDAVVAPVSLEKEPAGEASEATAGDEEPEATSDDDQPADEPDEAPVKEPATAGADGAAPDGPPAWALAVAAGAAVLAVALAIVVLFTWPGSVGGESPAKQEEQSEQAEEAGAEARAAAEDAIPEVLSYDYRTLDDDFAEAEEYLTDDFAAKRTALFDQKADTGLTLREQVVSEKVVVTARVAMTGLTRVSEDGDRATIVVYVDQDSQKGNAAPRLLQMWATLSMVSDGDDWLLDDICTETDCS